MSVVGLDLGNSNVVLAHAKRGGIDILLNAGSQRQTLSAVSLNGKERFIGEMAGPLLRSNFKNTVVEVKRFIGVQFKDAGVQKDIARLPNKEQVHEMADGRVGFNVTYDGEKLQLCAEDVLGMLLGHLKRTAEHGTEKPVHDVVISVPAYFSNHQRLAVLNSSRIAGLNTLRLINDTTATALEYGIWKSARNLFDEKEQHRVMFVNIGHSCYQVSIVSYIQGKLQVLATTWDTDFGGRAIDDLLVDHFSEEFKKKTGLDPRTNPKALIKMRDVCEKAKTTLTPEGVTMANLNAEFLMEDTDFTSKLTLEVFDDLIAGLRSRVGGPLERALKQAGLKADQMNSVEIVGGGSRPRFIKKLIGEVLGLDATKQNYGLSSTLNADESVARGCALNCAMLSPAFRVKEFAVIDQCSLPIRISWEQKEDKASSMESIEGDAITSDGKMNHLVLFQNGDELPKTRRVTFMRNEPFEIIAAYDETAWPLLPAGVPREVGRFVVSGMPSDGETIPRIRVNFRIDIHGIFNVESSQYLVEIKEPEPVEPTEEEKNAAAVAAAIAGSDGAEGKAAEGAAAAEGEAKVDGEGEVKKKKKKKSYKRVDLQVTMTGHGALSATELSNACERERTFEAHDRVIKETSIARNTVEEYIYKQRDNVDGDFREYGTDAERDTWREQLNEAESWLYDDAGTDQTKAVYEAKLADLSKIGVKLQSRMEETERRPEMIKQFGQRIQRLMAVATSTKEEHDHIDESERDTIKKHCGEAQTFIDESLAKINNQKTSEDPAVTTVQMQTRVQTAELICNPICNKRRPAPKVATPPPAAATPTPEAKADDENKGADADMPAADEAKAEPPTEDPNMDVD